MACEKKINFFTTVTLSDFHNTPYIEQLKKLSIGFELALLTPISSKSYLHTLTDLKKEIFSFWKFFKKFQIPIKDVRIHQPGGSTYYWFDNQSYDLLLDFFTLCREMGFYQYVIHAPFGKKSIDEETELKDFQKKLQALAQDKKIEVEEIVASHTNLPKHLRLYQGMLFEHFVANQKVFMLLDSNEYGSIQNMIHRLQEVQSKKFEVHSVHIHKESHKFLSSQEFLELLCYFSQGNIINEGFICNESSYEEFVKTKSENCVLPHDQKIRILQDYTHLLENFTIP